MNIEKEELLTIVGGGSGISGTVLSSIIKGVQFLYQLGQSLGTSINRMRKKNYC